jgi:glycine betaine/proline transport system substrate-binding protein
MVRIPGIAALAVILVSLPALALAQPAPPPSTLEPVEAASACGPNEITIADMRWPSASILAHIHRIILTSELGCTVRIVSGDTAVTASSMATTQQPAIAPELWTSRIPEIWNAATTAGSVRAMAATYRGGPLEGWFIPAYLAEDHPELARADQLFNERDAFGGIGDARFISCPADWACAIVNRNLMRALRLQIIFESEEPANRLDLDRRLSEAISRREPVLIYYWQPNAAIDQFSLKSIDLGLFNPDAWPCLGMNACDNPLPSSFPEAQVVIGAAAWLQDEAPLVADYLRAATLPLEEMNGLLAELGSEGSSPEAVAQRFYETAEDIWRAWLPAALN